MDSFIKNLARGAGAILRDGFRTKFKINYKTGPSDLVTEFDLASESFIFDKIKKKFPSHGLLGEESGHIIKAKNFWVVDPLDGTSAFSRGLAQFCVSIAFVSGNEIKLGAIYDPIADELFFAKKGAGATLDGKKIKASSRPGPEGIWYAIQMRSTLHLERAKLQARLLEHRVWTMGLGSVALAGAYVSCGRMDAMITKGLHPWDYAAAGLMLREAGAKVTDMKDKPYRWNSESMVAANTVLHKKMLRVVN